MFVVLTKKGYNLSNMNGVRWIIMEEQIVIINEEMITLGQLLKHLSLIGSGGMAKWYLQEYEVYVNGDHEQRRGKKLYDGTRITIPNESLTIHIQVVHEH